MAKMIRRVATGAAWLCAAVPAYAEPVAWPLPPVRQSGDAQRFVQAMPPRIDGGSIASRATPMLDRFFSFGEAGPVRRHGRSAIAQLGGFGLTIEALRSRIPEEGGASWAGGARSKLVSLGVQLGWATGAERFWAGLAGARRATAEPDTAGRGRLLDTQIAIGGGWQHGDQLRLGLDWLRISGGAATNGAERLIQLTAGAPLHERGARLTMEWAPGGYAAAIGPRFGIEARRARLSQDEARDLGTARDDTRLGLFLKAPF